MNATENSRIFFFFFTEKNSIKEQKERIVQKHRTKSKSIAHMKGGNKSIDFFFSLFNIGCYYLPCVCENQYTRQWIHTVHSIHTCNERCRNTISSLYLEHLEELVEKFRVFLPSFVWIYSFGEQKMVTESPKGWIIDKKSY